MGKRLSTKRAAYGLRFMRYISAAICILLLLFAAGCKEKDQGDKEEVQDGSFPLYWQEAVSAGADSVRAAMEVAGADKSSFLFYTDSHWSNNSGFSPRLLEELCKQTPVNKVFFGGDIVGAEPTVETLSERSIMEYLWQWRSEIRNLNHYSVVGNHDDGSATNSLFSYEYVYTYLFAPEESNEIVRGGYTYYYFDDNSERTRYLCLDTAYDDVYNMSSLELEFVAESLKSTPAGWHIVVIAHIWYEPDYAYDGDGPTPVVGLSERVLPLVEMLDHYNARVGEFEGCDGKVEFCVGGHVHRDYVGSTPGGIPIILCDTDSRGTRSGIECVEGTITEAAVSAIVADYTNHIVTVVRVGRGSSFVVELPTAAEADSSQITYINVLESVGYTEGLRLSSTHGGETLNTNSDITGFIPVKQGDIVYLKNVEMPDAKDNYGALIVYYAADQTFISSCFISSTDEITPTVYDETGNLIQFTVVEDAAFVRICARRIDGSSVITVNEAIN